LVSFAVGVALAVVVVRVTALDRPRLACSVMGCGSVAAAPSTTDDAAARELDRRVSVLRAEVAASASPTPAADAR
jgi:hypothetical protein